MALKNNRFIKEIKLVLENTTPLHIGGDKGEILRDKEKSLAYIPGTSLAGAFRAYLKANFYENLEVLFGRDRLSKVFFYDSYGKLIATETRPSVKINSALGIEENKFEREFIAQGHKFEVKIEIFAEDKESFKDFKKAIYTAIAAINSGNITLGSYKSSGAGLFKVLELKESDSDLTAKAGLLNYLKRENRFIDKSLKSIENESFESNDVTFLLEGKLKTPILIKGEDLMDPKVADGMNIRNSKGEYIIPGTSLKGVLRAEGERILNYFNKSDLEEEIFGSKGENKKKKNSKLKCFDTVIENPKVSKYNKIKLDKFTAGVVKGALMDDDPVIGKVKFRTTLNISEKLLEKQGIALISLIFRDIAIGALSLGGGFSIGRGRVKGEKLTIIKGKSIVYCYDFKNNKEEINKLEQCFTALRGE